MRGAVCLHPRRRGATFDRPASWGVTFVSMQKIFQMATTLAGIACAASLAVPSLNHAESIALKWESGTYVVPVVINNKITLDFTLDSGAADVSIPADVFSTLVRAKTIAPEDMLDSTVYTLADGTTQKASRFRIRSLKVGELELRNVVGSVSSPRGSLLLGQSFLSRLHTWSIDNQLHTLLINESAPTGAVDSTGVVHQKATQQSRTPASNRIAAGGEPSEPAEPRYGFLSPDSCGAAQKLCVSGPPDLCEQYRRDFAHFHVGCPGVTDTNVLGDPN
jgi:clan AA aspartic protease (TIGR02281 family)